MDQPQPLQLQPHQDEAFDPRDEYERLPGLYRRWEIEQLIDSGDYQILEHGEMADRTRVFVVYRKTSPAPAPEIGVAVTLVFDAERLAVRARIVRIDLEEPQLLAVAIDGNDEVTQARVHEIVARARSLAEIGPVAAVAGAEPAAVPAEPPRRCEEPP